MTSVSVNVSGTMKPESEVVTEGVCQDSNEKSSNVLGKITGQDIDYWISKRKVLIGRNSSQGSVDINIGFSSYVSRKHLVLNYERGRFFLSCVGKNGVFVDGQFNRLGGNPVPLDNVCTIRFPSTSIRLTFDPCPPGITRLNGTVPKKVEQDIRNEELDAASKLALMGSIKPEVFSPSNNLNSIENGFINSSNNKSISMGSPTQIAKHLLNRGVRGYLSAPPSPTGTISAVNSCPTSPRSQTPQYPMQQHLNDVTENLAAAASAIAASVNNEEQKHLENNLNGNSPADSKPPYSYAQLIIQAISSSPQHQLTLSGIYAHITKHYPYYRTADKGWQNSIRHNLSLNRYFVKVPRSQEESGKGSFWRVDPASERKLVEQAWRKRRQQRTVPHCFCTPITASISTITRSAPVSPDRSEILSASIHKPLSSIGSSPFTTGNHSSQIQLEQNQKLQIVQLTTAAAAAAGYSHSTPVSPLPPSSSSTSSLLEGYNKPNVTHTVTTMIQQQPVSIAPSSDHDKIRWPLHAAQQPGGFDSKPSVSIVLRPPTSSSVSTTAAVPQQIFQTQQNTATYQQQQQQPQIVQIDNSSQQQQQQQRLLHFQQAQLQQQIQQQQQHLQQQSQHLNITAAAALQNTINNSVAAGAANNSSVFLTSNVSTIKRENESYASDVPDSKKPKVLDETNGKDQNS